MAATPIGIRFMERPAGHVSTVELEDFERAEAAGLRDGFPLAMELTLHVDDLDRAVQDAAYPVRLSGWAQVPALSADRLAIEQGTVEFSVRLPDDPTGQRRLRYRIQLRAGDGREIYLDGFKRVRDDPGIDMWADMTTLFIRLHEGRSNQGTPLASGIAHISAEDFLHQLTSFEVLNAADEGERLAAAARFGRYFAGPLYDVYGGVFARPTVFEPDAPPRQKRPLRTSAPELRYFNTDDGLTLRLARYRGGDKGPVMLVHGLGVSSLAFAIDTIETNLLEYLYEHQYDVWLLDYRSSIELPYAATPHTADDIARLDWPAAVAKVLDETGRADLQVVAHCYGGVTFTMAMLAGLTGVRSAVCSQVGAHTLVGTAARLKAGLHVTEFLDAIGIEDLTMYTDAHADWVNELFDRALALYPVPAEERCGSRVCHRVTFLYAPLYEHDQLNNATHDVLHELFGVASVANFNHLGHMVRAGHVVAADGADSYLPHPERLAIPIRFIHGAENQTWLPESTAVTLRWLAEANGEALYSREVIPDYGHIDCIFGRNAARDVYPHILEHLDQTA